VEYYKIRFNSGEGVEGLEGYQVVDNGYQVRVTDLDGNDIVLPQDYSFDGTEGKEADTPAWG
jgi:hypothetical protein